VKNQLHNSTNETSENEVLEKVCAFLISFLKVILKVIVKLLLAIIRTIRNVFHSITNKLKPHFYQLEELIYSRAKDLFGI